MRRATDSPRAELARRLRPDFVFLDLGLPGMDGLAVARQLRADPQLARTRIIAMTGSGREDDREAAREAASTNTCSSRSISSSCAACSAERGLRGRAFQGRMKRLRKTV
jgi:CheY-like chemotaxis protein